MKYKACSEKHRKEAIKLLGIKCEKCGSKANVQLHHKDRNPQNNEPKNWQRLCRKCHIEIHVLIRNGNHYRYQKKEISPQLKKSILETVKRVIWELTKCNTSCKM